MYAGESARHLRGAKIVDISVLGQAAQLLGWSDLTIDPLSSQIFRLQDEFESTVTCRPF